MVDAQKTLQDLSSMSSLARPCGRWAGTMATELVMESVPHSMSTKDRIALVLVGLIRKC